MCRTIPHRQPSGVALSGRHEACRISVELMYSLPFPAGPAANIQLPCATQVNYTTITRKLLVLVQAFISTL
jgi:hypothetical protein